MSASWRMFCAFELPETLRTRIDEHSQRMRAAVPDAAASWSRAEKIHLTLKFFGNVDPERVPVISATAAQVVKKFSPFPLVVGTSGSFTRRAPVLWIGIQDPSGTLLHLQHLLENECARQGFPTEGRVYRPHLTIARIRKPDNADRLVQAHLSTQFANEEVTLSELILFRSELSSKGSKYTAISRQRLEH